MFCADTRLWNFLPLYEAIGGETLKACCHWTVLTDPYAVAGSDEPPALQEPPGGTRPCRLSPRHHGIPLVHWFLRGRAVHKLFLHSMLGSREDLLNNCDVQHSSEGSASPSTAVQSSSQSEKCSWKPLKAVADKGFTVFSYQWKRSVILIIPSEPFWRSWAQFLQLQRMCITQGGGIHHLPWS